MNKIRKESIYEGNNLREATIQIGTISVKIAGVRFGTLVHVSLTVFPCPEVSTVTREASLNISGYN